MKLTDILAKQSVGRFAKSEIGEQKSYGTFDINKLIAILVEKYTSLASDSTESGKAAQKALDFLKSMEPYELIYHLMPTGFKRSDKDQWVDLIFSPSSQLALDVMPVFRWNFGTGEASIVDWMTRRTSEEGFPKPTKPKKDYQPN